MTKEDAIDILKAFAEGKMQAAEFEYALYDADDTLKELLTGQGINWQQTFARPDPYTYLCNLGDVTTGMQKQSALGTVWLWLEKNGISFSKQSQAALISEILGSCGVPPPFVDMASNYVETLLAEGVQDKKQLEKKVKEKLNTLFPHHKKKPKWIQGDAWPIIEGMPACFLGQMDVKDYANWHDDGVIYIFHDLKNNTIITVTQQY